jgi:hypothetical protein
MSYTLADFRRDVARQYTAELSPHERRRLLEDMSPEERLRDVPPEEMLRALPADVRARLKQLLAQDNSDDTTDD